MGVADNCRADHVCEVNKEIRVFETASGGMSVSKALQKKGTRKVGTVRVMSMYISFIYIDTLVKRKSRTETDDALASASVSIDVDDVETTLAEKSSVSEDKAPVAKKKQSASLYRPPTHNELQALKETENLFSSNLMKLQASCQLAR